MTVTMALFIRIPANNGKKKETILKVNLKITTQYNKQTIKMIKNEENIFFYLNVRKFF